MNVFELMGVIAINNTEANNRIDDTNNRAGILAKGFKSVGRVAGTMGKAVVAGVGAGAAAMGALMKSSIGAFAEYEQLKGGVETLFKDSSGAVLKYADQAYKTAGMSTNDYMSTVTGFSASLLKSLGGDTEAAAALSDRAVRDMADNANKMGTSMGSIQDAYQGFAKQNYTMLDNLKLGYGGTKTEMQRLLKDAQKIKKAQGENVKYSINSFADIVEAIGVVQDQMGITGTTAQEASETIAGSFSSAASAWQNLLVGIADGNQDLGQLVTNFVESGKTAAKNITKVLPSLVEGVRGLIDGIAPEIPGIIQEIFPALLDGAIALIGGLAQALPGMLAVLGDTLSMIWANNVWPAIQDFFKIQFGVELPDWSVIGPQLEEGVSGVMENLGTACENISKFFIGIGNWVSQNQSLVTGFLGAVALALLAINAPLTLMGIALLLVAANWDTIKTAVDAAMKAVGDFFNKKVPEWWESTVVQPVKEAWEGVKTWIDNTITSVGNFFTQKIPAGFNQFIQGIVDGWNKVTGAIGSAIEAVNSFFGISSAGGDLYNADGSLADGVYVSNEMSGYLNGGVGLGAASAAGVSFKELLSGGGGGGNKVKKNAKGAIFSRSTIFDTRLGLQEVGEAGPEAVAPISVLRQYVREEVAAVNNENARQMQGMREDFRQFMGELPDMLAASFASMKFDVNNREFARLVKAVT